MTGRHAAPYEADADAFDSIFHDRPRHRLDEVDADGFVLALRSPDGATEIWHLDGVAWCDAPAPPRWHRCRPQTRGFVRWFTEVLRCRCGAIGDRDFGIVQWVDRNSRHKAAS